MEELIYPRQDAPRLRSVEVTGDYSVRVVFSDEQVREVDLSRWFVDPTGKLLGEPEDFARVRLHEVSDCLMWTDDFHVHGEMLYEVSVSGSR